MQAYRKLRLRVVQVVVWVYVGQLTRHCLNYNKVSNVRAISITDVMVCMHLLKLSFENNHGLVKHVKKILIDAHYFEKR